MSILVVNLKTSQEYLVHISYDAKIPLQRFTIIEYKKRRAVILMFFSDG